MAQAALECTAVGWRERRSGVQVEVSKFVGASVRTVSGIRGTVKKAIRPGSSGSTPGSFRGAFEDKLVHSDIVMLKAWVAVDIPRFFNPVTNLLARPVRAARAAKERAVHRRTAALDGSVQASNVTEGMTEAGAEAAFMSADCFKGSRAGMKFCLGPRGLGYYTDAGPNSGCGGCVAAVTAAVAGLEATPDQPGAETGWVGARTVAQLRRELRVGAPREQDSLYKPVDRVERLFPALRVPKALQKALPFASKPKVEVPRRRSTLEQRRAVPLEKPEKQVCPYMLVQQVTPDSNDGQFFVHDRISWLQMYTLIQQLNAIRNEKATKRRDQKKKSLDKRAKKQEDEQAWREQLNTVERKKRYMQQAAEARRNAKRART